VNPNGSYEPGFFRIANTTIQRLRVCHGFKVVRTRPRDERTAEMLFCLNSSKKCKKETNAELYIKMDWPVGQGKGICVPTFNLKILSDVEEGQEIKAYYNFREEKYY